MTGSTQDAERNRISARLSRYARVGAGLGGVAARIAGGRLFGANVSDRGNALALTEALGGLKGPLMKVAQLMATIPDALPPEYATELATLQSNAPPMGAAFVKRRMMAELGADWRSRFAEFDLHPTAAASLGQVHRATTVDGQRLAVKLQYPDMASAVEADLSQLDILFGLHRQFDALYRSILVDEPLVNVPSIHTDLSTGRLLAMQWLEGKPLLSFKQSDAETRNLLATAMFKAWWLPFSHHGVIHGDPHLGNYTVFESNGFAGGINLLDYGCIRIFPPSFVGGVVDLYRGLLEHDQARIVHAYETWGFKGLNKDLIEILNLWARFIYGPLLDDRTRTVADGVAPGEYGRKEAFTVHQALKEKGPVTVPREFVFMDRAAIGLGGVFLHLNAELNFYRLFNEAIDGFSVDHVTKQQSFALTLAGLN
ncbi:MAG: AarF/ABC1/UbiB kinase family protein [Alphaproteobacteria bacterium]|nr:AarF/ABC1/UbiB kinase family protein [Alphaproteobacteria bacterium]